MTETTSGDLPAPSRRTVLAGLAGGAVVGGVAGAGVASAANGGGGLRSETLVFDVACLGQTWRDVIPRNNMGEADARIPFMVEGHVYPEGEITAGEELYVPTSQNAIGVWFCRGWLIIDGERIEPHVISDQHYLLGDITESFPADGLVTQGMEGQNVFGWKAPRVITGGTGKYRGAIGEATQEHIGFNTTIIDDGLGDNALNFRFTFDMLLPD